MEAVLKNLQLRNFRNHADVSLHAEKQQLILIGKNAVGKTNIIEALQLISMLSSFRTSRWHDIPLSHQDDADTASDAYPESARGAVVQAEFDQNGRQLEIKLTINEGRRQYFLNDKKRTRDELMGLIPTVLFVPEDLDIIKGPAERRRSLLDTVGQQLSHTYHKILTDYQRTLRQRNRLLRQQRESGSRFGYTGEPARPPESDGLTGYTAPDEPSSPDGYTGPTNSGGLRGYASRSTLIQESWDESLITIGAQLFVNRLKLYKRLAEKAAAYYAELSEGERLTSAYIPGFGAVGEHSRSEVEAAYRQQLDVLRNEERARGSSLIGPHRDEISFAIDGRDARTFGSQGQQRTIALACKLAELDLICEISGNTPLLLLDDVMSELDGRRRSALLTLLNREICAVITATDTDGLDADLLKKAQIIRLHADSERL
ncbi:MAG: AAA family ATPase [Coriobacteriales bacterium]|jgi:DNA replication and repair protein RecF|nr:AAA family ATPase [Coriobacteriales bacterium]